MADSRSTSIYLTWAGGQFNFDAVLNEHHDIESTVTEHAVEEGVNIVDHVRPNPIQIRIRGFITNTPVASADFSRIGEVLQTYDNNAAPQTKDPPGTPPIVITPPQPPLQALLSLNGVVNAIQNKLFGDGAFTLQQSSDRNRLPDQNFSALVDEPTSGNPQNYVAAALDMLTTLRDDAELITVIAPHKGPYNNMILSKIGFDRGVAQGGSAYFDLELREIRIVQSATAAAPQPTIIKANIPVKTGAQATVPPARQLTAARAIVLNGQPSTANVGTVQ
jgi:hypothetical protein